MSTALQPDRVTDAQVEIGRRMARKVFEKRGNHREAHLSEAELAALLAMAAHVGALKGT